MRVEPAETSQGKCERHRTPVGSERRSRDFMLQWLCKSSSRLGRGRLVALELTVYTTSWTLYRRGSFMNRPNEVAETQSIRDPMVPSGSGPPATPGSNRSYDPGCGHSVG